MALRDRAVLVLENDGRTGEFHFLGPEPTEEFDRQFLMGNRGQLIREAYDVFTDESDAERSGEGYFVDGGQGTDTTTLSFEGGHDRDEYHGLQTQWGDGSTETDRWDATGAPPDTQAQVLKWWARSAAADSFRSLAKLHWGEWTDGSIDGESGIFGEPMQVVVSTVRIERNSNKPSSFEGTVELIRASSLTDLDDAADSDLVDVPDF